MLYYFQPTTYDRLGGAPILVLYPLRVMVKRPRTLDPPKNHARKVRTEGFGRLISGVAGPSLIPLVLSNFGFGAVYSLVGSVALIAVAIVFVFGRETHGRTLEESADPNALDLR